MKLVLLFWICIVWILVSCGNNTQVTNELTNLEQDPAYIDSVNHILKIALDTAQVEGSILIYDVQSSVFYSNDYEWAKVNRLPASTFKIPNSIIALELGIVKNDSTYFKWDGHKRRMKIWEQDLTFAQAYAYSCVPCYQEIARKIGSDKMNSYLNKWKYGNQTITDSVIDRFWLEGNFGINQYEQIYFLKKLQSNELGVSDNTLNVMRRIMITKETSNGILRGKTGWSIVDGQDNGWYVGYVEQHNRVFIVATNINPKPTLNLELFKEYRLGLSIRGLEAIGVEL